MQGADEGPEKQAPWDELLNAEFMQLIVETGPADFKDTSRLHPIPGSLLQCLKDTRPLGLSSRASADRPEVGILRMTPQLDQIRTG